MDSLTFHRSTTSILFTPLRSGSPFSPSINLTQPDTHLHLDVSTSRRSTRKRERASSSTHHHTINRALHWAYYKPTPHCRSKCSRHHASKSTCHQISKAHPESRHYSWVKIMAPAPTHMHPTDIWPLITIYKHHGSQADYGAPFELVHSDVCGPFSTPTSAGHCYYIICIDDYTCYTIVWVLPDKKSKTSTSAYHTDIREKEKDSRYILAQSPSHSHHHTFKHIYYHAPLRNTLTSEPIHIHFQTYQLEPTNTLTPKASIMHSPPHAKVHIPWHQAYDAPSLRGTKPTRPTPTGHLSLPSVPETFTFFIFHTPLPPNPAEATQRTPPIRSTNLPHDASRRTCSRCHRSHHDNLQHLHCTPIMRLSQPTSHRTTN